MKEKLVKNSIVGVFVGLYAIVSIISTIHVIDFFALTNPHWLAVSLAIAFEIGAAASLASIVILDKTNRNLVWFLFFLLTGMQCMGNMYYAYDNAQGYQSWMELFSLNEEEPIFQKRVLAIISGAILPLVALGFIKSLVDYIRPAKTEDEVKIETEDKVSLATEEPNEKLEVKTVAEEIVPIVPSVKPEIKNDKAPVEVIDEDELLKESVIKAAPDKLETVKVEAPMETIESIDELSNEDVDELIEDDEIAKNDAKSQAIKEVHSEQNGGLRQEENSSKWPGKNIVNDERKFGPPDINNGSVA